MSPVRRTVRFSRPAVAGPPVTSPVLASNCDPWHGQMIVPFVTSETAQPACGQVEENAVKDPSVGWATTLWPTTFPPPTGTSATGTDLSLIHI